MLRKMNLTTSSINKRLEAKLIFKLSSYPQYLSALQSINESAAVNDGLHIKDCELLYFLLNNSG